MTTRMERGFTLVELLVAIVLFGIVGTAIYQVLVNNQRLYMAQSEQVDVNASTRAGMALLPAELRELNAQDPAGSDIVAMSESSLTYRAMRNLYFLCDDPSLLGLQIVLDNSEVFGLRRLDPARDSILIYAENNPSTRTDVEWLRADVLAAVPGNDCPGGRPSLTVTLAGVSTAAIGGLGGVQNGAPVRGFEVTQLWLYPDAGGLFWMGTRTRQKTGGWNETHPVVGPLASTGVEMAYYNAAGQATTNLGQVARVDVAIAGQSVAAVRTPRGTELLVDTLVTHVALRNNRTY